MIGIIGFATLLFLPGTWVTFCLPLPGLPFWAKVLTGTMLAPLVVYLQYCTIRLLGAPFELTVILLVGLNLPAAYLVYRQRSSSSIPDRSTIVSCVTVLLIAFASLSPQIFYEQRRMFVPEHPWMHSDVIYAIANGDLPPEEPLLAGVKLAYHWAGHTYQAVLSYLINSPPVSSFIWSNLLWLLFISAFTAGLVAELGGNHLSRVTSVVCLFFGVNFVGYILEQASMLRWGGDWRYTPWVLKFFGFNQMPFALGMFVAIVYLAIRPWSGQPHRNPFILICLLLCGIGIIYPILFPPACTIIVAKAVAISVDRAGGRQAFPYGQLLMLGVILLVGVYPVSESGTHRAES